MAQVEILSKVFGIDLPEEETFEQRLEGGESQIFGEEKLR